MDEDDWMTPEEVRSARRILGEMWGMGRPLHAAELARALRLTGRDPGLAVIRWERGEPRISGPAMTAVRAMLDGWRPPWSVPRATELALNPSEERYERG